MKIFLASCTSSHSIQHDNNVGHIRNTLELAGHSVYQYTYDVQEQGIVESEEERTSRKLLRVYSPRFSHTSAALETDGTCATADPIENRIFNPGSIHTIKTGIFHVDSVSGDRMVSTLLIESPTVEAHPRILMDTPGDPLGGAKVSIPHDDAVYAKKQVLRSIR